MLSPGIWVIAELRETHSRTLVLNSAGQCISLPVAPATNYHELDGLKQYKFVLSQSENQ